MRYQIRTFKSWVNESKTNEGFADLFRDISQKFFNFLKNFPGLSFLKGRFTGNGSWILNKVMDSKTGKLERGIEFIPASTTKEIVDFASKEGSIIKGTEGEESALESFNWDETTVDPVNEVVVPLEHPNPIVKNVGADELQKKLERQILLSKNFPDRKSKPVLIWGSPGIGKTQIVRSLAKKYDMDIEIINLAELGPDVLLIPTKGEEGQISLATPDNLPVYDIRSKNAKEQEAAKNGIGKDGKPRGGILFFDELSRGHDSNLAAAIPLIENRFIQKWHIASHWVIFAAANREDDDQTKFKFSSALGNRFSQVNYVPDIEKWSEWAEQHKMKMDDETYQLVFDREMIDFLKFRKELFHKYDPEVSLEVFPSPRAWTNAAEEIANARALGEDLTFGDIEDIVSTYVGVDVGKQYVAFLRLIKSIDPKTLKNVWTNQEKADLPPKEKNGDYKSDSLQAMLTAILLDKKGEELTFNEVKNFIDYLIRLDDPRYAMVAIKSLLKEHPYLRSKSKTHDKESPEYNEDHLKSTEYIAKEFASKYRKEVKKEGL